MVLDIGHVSMKIKFKILELRMLFVKPWRLDEFDTKVEIDL